VIREFLGVRLRPLVHTPGKVAFLLSRSQFFCFPHGTGFWVGGEITLRPPDYLTGRSVLCYCWGVQLSSDTEVASPHKRYPSLSRLFSLEGNRGVSAAGPPGDAVGWGGIWEGLCIRWGCGCSVRFGSRSCPADQSSSSCSSPSIYS